MKIIDLTKTCSVCEGHETDIHYIRKTPIWVKSKYGNGVWCSSCYSKWRHSRPQNKEQRREYMSEYRKRDSVKERKRIYAINYRNDNKEKIRDTRRQTTKRCIRYKNTLMLLDEPLRIGVCNWCRRVVPFDTMQTQLHHDENRYDDADVLRYTIELCNSCHTAETNRLRYEEKQEEISHRSCTSCGTKFTDISSTGSFKWSRSKVNPSEWWCRKCYDRWDKQKPERRERKREYNKGYWQRPEVILKNRERCRERHHAKQV